VLRKVIYSFLTMIMLITCLSLVQNVHAAEAESSITAKPTASKVYINKQAIALQGYNIEGNNYFKLRDLAQSLKGTDKQFSVDWNGVKQTIELKGNAPYSPIGTELASTSSKKSEAAIASKSKIMINNKEVALTAYTIQGNTYFKLRDLGEYLQIPVIYRPADQSIQIMTAKEVQIKQYSDVVVYNNTDDYEYGYYLDVSFRYLYQAAGKLYILENPIDNRYLNTEESSVLNIYEVSNSKNNKKTLKKELPLFGGFHIGEDGNYYVVYGQLNYEESNTKPVYKVVKYDKQWNKLAEVDIKDAYVIRPFSAGNLSIDSQNGKLIVHSTRTRYLSEDGKNHQSNITFAIDMNTMQLIRNGEQWPSNHVSHSFAAYVKIDGDQIVYADHGDAFPRAHAFQIEKEGKKKLFVQEFAPSLGGSTGTNYTGTYLGGLEVGKSNYVVVSTYSKLYENDINSQNVRVEYFGKDTNNPTAFTLWLTNYEAKDNVSITQSHIVKLDNQSFVILWEEIRSGNKPNKLYYAVVSDSGDILQKPKELAGIPAPGNMIPLVKDRTITWYYSDTQNSKSANPIELYTLTVPAFEIKETTKPVDTPTVKRDGDGLIDAVAQLGYTLRQFNHDSTGMDKMFVIEDMDNEFVFNYMFYSDYSAQVEGRVGHSIHSFDQIDEITSQLEIVKAIAEADLQISIPDADKQLLAAIQKNTSVVKELHKHYPFELHLQGVTFKMEIYQVHYPPAVVPTYIVEINSIVDAKKSK